MNYYLFDNQEVKGPFSLSTIAEMLNSGDIADGALAAAEGSEDWIPVAQLARTKNGGSEVGGDTPFPAAMPIRKTGFSQSNVPTFCCSHCATKIVDLPTTAGACATCPSCGQDLVVPAISDDFSQPVISPPVRALPPTPGTKKPISKPGRQKSLKISALILAIVAVISVFMIRNRANSSDLAKPEVIESIRKEAIEKKILQSREKSGKIVFHLPNDERPYTGWTKETSSDGGLKLAKIKNGILNGAYVEYFESGQKQIEGTNINGVKEGRQTSWYANGQKESERVFKNGKVESLLVKYKPNGDECSESKVENGKGKELSYDEEGALIATVTYEAGEGTLKFNKPDDDRYTIPDMKAILEQELRQARLEKKLEDSNEYSDKVHFAARLKSIYDTDWSGCNPELKKCANTLKHTIDLYLNNENVTSDVMDQYKVFLEVVKARAKNFVFAGKDISKMCDEVDKKMSRDKLYR